MFIFDSLRTTELIAFAARPSTDSSIGILFSKHKNDFGEETD